MTTCKSLLILWLVLWAEADRPGDFEQSQAGDDARVRNGGGPRVQRYEDASATSDASLLGSLSELNGTMGKELVHRGLDLDISYLQSLSDAWNITMQVPLLDRAEALGLVWASYREQPIKSSSLAQNGDQSVAEVDEWKCHNHIVQCPAQIKGMGVQENLDGVKWEIVQKSSWKSKAGNLLAALMMVGASVLAVMTGPAAPLAGLAIAGGAIAATALWGGANNGKPKCPVVEFHKLKKDAGWFSRKLGFATEQKVMLQDLTLAMTIGFVQQAMNTDEREAHDFKTEAVRNGRGIFACNVLMYDDSYWDTKLTNSELYTEDGVRDEAGMNQAELDEEEYKRALETNKPSQQALQWCRYLMCKHSNVNSKPMGHRS